MTIPPLGYLFSDFDVSDLNPNWQCVVAIRGWKKDLHDVAFGTYLLANYYAQFDYDAMTVSFGMNTLNSWSA